MLRAGSLLVAAAALAAPTLLRATPSRRTPPPRGFLATSVSAASPRSWFALGSTPCSAGRCVAIIATGDAGRHWHRMPAPTRVFAPLTPAAGAAQAIRFADRRNGWAYGGGLWSTHDGGRHWRRVALRTGVVTDVTSARGRVYVLNTACNTAGMMCQLGRLLSGGVGSDRLSPVPRLPRLGFPGAGFGGSLVSGGEALLVAHVQGARSGRSFVYGSTAGRWSRRTVPPCRNEAFELGVSPGGTVFAVCAGQPSAGSQGKRAYRSMDGGRHWRRLASPPSTGYASQLAAVDGGTAFLANGRGDVVVTRDAGRSWRPALSGARGGGWSDVQFVNPRVGFALPWGLQQRRFLAVTRDGGRHWQFRTFR